MSTENGTRFADVQKAAGHRDPSTTRLYASGMAPAGGPHCQSLSSLMQDAAWHEAKEIAMDLTWWSEHSSELPLLLLTAVVTHLLMSFSQTLMHYGLGHRQLGGIFFRNHIHFHHVHYSKDHLVSLVHIKNDGNNTPFFLIPVALMVLTTYFIFPLGLFLIQIITAFASLSAHVYLDKQYHIAGSPLLRFAWFRRKQQLHFVHHKHADSNFAIIDNFGTDFWVLIEIHADDAGNPPPESLGGGPGRVKRAVRAF